MTYFSRVEKSEEKKAFKGLPCENDSENFRKAFKEMSKQFCG